MQGPEAQGESWPEATWRSVDRAEARELDGPCVSRVALSSSRNPCTTEQHASWWLVFTAEQTCGPAGSHGDGRGAVELLCDLNGSVPSPNPAGLTQPLLVWW